MFTFREFMQQQKQFTVRYFIGLQRGKLVLDTSLR